MQLTATSGKRKGLLWWLFPGLFIDVSCPQYMQIAGRKSNTFILRCIEMGCWRDGGCNVGPVFSAVIFWYMMMMSNVCIFYLCCSGGGIPHRVQCHHHVCAILPGESDRCDLFQPFRGFLLQPDHTVRLPERSLPVRSRRQRGPRLPHANLR